MDYTVVLDSRGEANTHYMSKYDVQGIPHAFVISKKAQIAWHGHPMEGGFEAAIRQCVAEPSKPQFDLNSLTHDKMKSMPVSELKEILRSKAVDYSGAVEKEDLIKLIETKILNH